MRSIVVVIWAMTLGLPAIAAEQPYAAFFGHYVGQTMYETDRDVSIRDLEVRIRPKGKGFNVAWTTVTHRPNGRRKRTHLDIHFRPSSRPDVYSSAMRTNRFGQTVPNDPLKGEPFVWARILGTTLVVHALIITDAGSYEVQTYERSLAPDGMNLHFSRFRDGKLLKTITAKLKRIDRPDREKGGK